MSACIVWKCPRPAMIGARALCSVHDSAERDVRGPMRGDALRWAELLDDDAVASDIAAHNAAHRVDAWNA